MIDVSPHENLKFKSSWKSAHRLSQFRRYNISNGSRRGKTLSETCFFSAGSRPDIRSRNTGRAITIYFSSALLFGIHIMLKTYWIAQSVKSLGYFVPQWSHVPFQSCNSVPGFALFHKSLLTSHLNVFFFLWLTFVSQVQMPTLLCHSHSFSHHKWPFKFLVHSNLQNKFPYCNFTHPISKQVKDF